MSPLATVLSSLLAFTAYTWLLKNAPISTVTTYAYVNPVIAVLLGAVVLSEEVTALVVVGAAAIVLSVATVVREESGGGEEGSGEGPIPARMRRRSLRRASPSS